MTPRGGGSASGLVLDAAAFAGHGVRIDLGRVGIMLTDVAADIGGVRAFASGKARRADVNPLLVTT